MVCAESVLLLLDCWVFKLMYSSQLSNDQEATAIAVFNSLTEAYIHAKP